MLAPPMVVSGDSPHYLVMINSLIEDGDLNVKNNYDQALQGDWDAGARFRGFLIDRHLDHSVDAKERSFHTPFVPLILAGLVFPLRGTKWVEPVCIWLIMAGTLAALWFLAVQIKSPLWAAAVALGTPLWCFSRDVWTEPWTAAAWIGLLFCQHPAAVSILAFCGTLVRYPFLWSFCRWRL